MAFEKAGKRLKEIAKQQVVSEIGCVAEQTEKLVNDRKMKCLFRTAGLGDVEVNASQIKVKGIVELFVHDAKAGITMQRKTDDGIVLQDLKGQRRSHDGFRLSKKGIDSRGIEYEDGTGDKWQIPLNKEVKSYNTRIVLKAPQGSSYWCRVSVGKGSVFGTLGNKISCDLRKDVLQSSIL